MRRYGFGVAVLLAVAAVARPQDEAAKKDLKAMEGTWTATLHEADGKATSKEEAEKVRAKLVVKDGKYTVYFNKEGAEKEVGRGTIKLDPAKKPKEIDVTVEAGPNKDKVMQGIYEIKADEMRV